MVEEIGLFGKISKTFKPGLDMDAMASEINHKIESGQLPSGDQAIAELDSEFKSLAISDKPKSRLKVRRTSNDIGMSYMTSHWLYEGLRELANKRLKTPQYGDPARDRALQRVWREEPILAGAVYSMSTKMTALSWQIIGDREKALTYAKILARAGHIDGYDWGGFSSSSTADFFTTDRGVFWEIARKGTDRTFGPMVDIGHIDALACELTGNTKRPVKYISELTNQKIDFRPGEFIHFTSMPSPREKDLGIGFCAVSRALRAASLLTGLHDYDDEKLSNLPPEGVASVMGLTQSEFQDAIKLWKAARERDNSLTFPQVLWLIGSQPNVKVGVDFVGFSQTPESFDRNDVVTQYVNTLALAFGVDVREFWPMSTSALGTASESEIQHMKAKGKGHGEYVSISQRHINGELPEDVDFGYDTQDIDEDMRAAEIAGTWIKAFMPLLMPGQQSQQPQPGIVSSKQEENGNGKENQDSMKPLLSRDEFLRLLIDKRVLPDYLLGDDRAIVLDFDVHIKEERQEKYSGFEYKDGMLSEIRLPAIRLNLNNKPKLLQDKISDKIPVALAIKQATEEELASRNIRGNPIPKKEVSRGANITRKTIRGELEVWRKNDELAPHSLDPKEEDAYIERIFNS